MALRGGRPLLLIDLAVPRDIDAACAEIDGVSLYDIDDLQAVIARNRKVRQAEARKAEGIIEEEIQQFAAWLGSLEVLPTLAALRAHATEIAEQVVRENAGKWEAASPSATSSGSTRSPARSSTGCCTTPTARLKELQRRPGARPDGADSRPVRARGRGATRRTFEAARGPRAAGRGARAPPRRR